MVLHGAVSMRLRPGGTPRDRVTTDGLACSPRATRETVGDDGIHRCRPSLTHRREQNHRGITQRSSPMRGLGTSDPAWCFCRAVDKPRPYVRLRPRLCPPLPPLAEQRRESSARFPALMSALMAAYREARAEPSQPRPSRVPCVHPVLTQPRFPPPRHTPSTLPATAAASVPVIPTPESRFADRRPLAAHVPHMVGVKIPS